ncbi:MAG: leucine zipper domain-containing protein [Gammaproteobacteria bacterium]|nr:leucine zipper domain-containing protein [Gammaproteobacteria bacterium]
MNIHKNARSTLKGRVLLVRRMEEEGLRVQEAAQASGVSVRPAYKWRARYRTEGLEGLQDRSSRPHCSPHRTPAGVRTKIQTLRWQRRTYREISRLTPAKASMLLQNGVDHICALLTSNVPMVAVRFH